MRRSLSKTFSLFPIFSIGALTTLFAGVARADVPPPDGEKYVGYTFTISGLTKTPDQVVFAYPCGTSSGAPHDEIRLVEDGKAITVGRRGGSCELYTVTKKSYDDWLAKYTPSNTNQDPALSAFASKAKKCDGAPTPSFVLASTDTRSSIDELLDVTTLTEASCTIVSRGNTKPTTKETTETTAPAKDPPAENTSGIGSPTSSPSPSPTTPAASDDGGCSVGGTANAAAPWLLALTVPVIVFGSRRRRRNAEEKK